MNAFSSPVLLSMIERIGWAVIHSCWLGLLNAVALALALRLVREAPTRHLLCMIALVATLGGAIAMSARTSPEFDTKLLAAVSTTNPQAAPQLRAEPSLHAGPGRERARTIGSGGQLSVSAKAIPPGVAADIERPANETTAFPPATWRMWIAPVLPWLSLGWLLGVILLSVRHCTGWLRVRAWRRSGTLLTSPPTQGFADALTRKLQLRTVVPIMESARVLAPMLVGTVRPVILLPLRVISGFREREVEAILAHELAHFARGDAWANGLQLFCETILFFHPAVWWMSRRARIERENAADDLALSICQDRFEYAHALTRLAEESSAPQFALAATDGVLLERVRRLLIPMRPEAFVGGGWAAGALLIAPLIFTVLLVSKTARADADEHRAAVPAASRHAAADSKTWIEDAFQLDDAAKRVAAIERIRAAMQSTNVEEARAGVKAFVQLGPIEFDKASFRPVVRALLGSADAPTRGAAASAFTMTGADADDLDRILALADDAAPEVREPLTGIIVRLTKGDLTGKPASDAILKLMNNLPRDSRSVAHAMWGVKFSPEIEGRVLEFCREIPAAGNSVVGYNFFYGALSTQANKSEASCRRLIELLAHQDTTNIAGRSAWGLQQGVAREQFPLVADAMVKVIEARSDGYLRENALRCLRTYGDGRNAPALRAVLAKPGVTGDFRKLLEETVASLERRPLAATVAAASTDLVAQHTPANAAPGANPPAGAGTAAAQDTLVRNEALVEQNRRAARLRAAEDRRNYSPEQLQEIETLYQVANTKGKRTAEARASLKQLLDKYDKANRTGCATLYLGQASVGAERLEYLTRAVEKFSDCYYFNGCQVGGYGRYVLALTLWENGQKDKARALLEELKTKYKDATDHRGVPMGAIALAVEKELAKQK
jgi:beta-lactamase regulating signal transducer with metallopeptidase domain/TolA-binding protein